MITLGSLISTVCLDVINVILVDYLFRSLYQVKFKSKKKILLGVIAVIYIIVHLKFYYGKNTIFIDSLMIFGVSVLYEFEKVKRIKTIAFILITYLTVDFLIYHLFVWIFNINAIVNEFITNDIMNTFEITLTKYFLYVIIECILLKVNRLDERRLKTFKYISFCTSIFYGVTILIFDNEVLFYHERVGRIFVFTLILYNAVLVIFNYYQNMHIRTVNTLETMKQNRSYQGMYWKEYYKNYEAIRKTKHDMLNGYAGLYGLVKEERYDELKEYLESSIKNLKEMKSVHYFGNPLIDAIVSKKMSDAKEKGISIILHCGIISIGNIDEEDLGILFANALDNAIEATEKSSFDRIDVHISTINCFLKINIINYVDDSSKVSFRKTSKLIDRDNHGIGIKSMKDTVKKYHGSLKYDKEDHKIILSIIMNIDC